METESFVYFVFWWLRFTAGGGRRNISGFKRRLRGRFGASPPAVSLSFFSSLPKWETNKKKKKRTRKAKFLFWWIAVWQTTDYQNKTLRDLSKVLFIFFKFKRIKRFYCCSSASFLLVGISLCTRNKFPQRKGPLSFVKNYQPKYEKVAASPRWPHIPFVDTDLLHWMD